MSTLDEFSIRMKALGNRIVHNSAQLTRKVGLAADQAIVTGTPVDTGRARSNWQTTINVAATDVIDTYAPGHDGNTGAENAQAAIRQAEAVISGYTSGEEIKITNNLPYIQRLNDGYSAQAPAHFVEDALAEAERVVRNGRIVDG